MPGRAVWPEDLMPFDRVMRVLRSVVAETVAQKTTPEERPRVLLAVQVTVYRNFDTTQLGSRDRIGIRNYVTRLVDVTKQKLGSEKVGEG